jgi:hypothetical protein
MPRIARNRLTGFIGEKRSIFDEIAVSGTRESNEVDKRSAVELCGLEKLCGIEFVTVQGVLTQ